MPEPAARIASRSSTCSSSARMLFAIGLYVALSKRNAIGVLMGIELMLNAVNLTLLASRASSSRRGRSMARSSPSFVITVAAAEAAVALALAVAVYQHRETVEHRRDRPAAMVSATEAALTMWSKLMDVKNGYAAEVWKELFDAEGVSNRVVPPLDERRADVAAARDLGARQQDARRRRDHEEDLGSLLARRSPKASSGRSCCCRWRRC